MRILLFNGTGNVVNSAGGAEKVFCNMANALVCRGHQVLAVCNDISSGMPFYPLDERVNFVNLNGSGKKIFRSPFYLKLFREMTKPFRHYVPNPVTPVKSQSIAEKMRPVLEQYEPDIIICHFLSDMPAVSRLQSGLPVIVIQHGNPFTELLGKSRHDLRPLDLCNVIQVLLPSYIPPVKRLCSTKVVAIPNTVQQVPAKTYAEKSRYSICMVGRFEKDKQQHLLIEAFSKIAKKYPNWQINFYGSESPKKGYHSYSKKLIWRYQLEQQVFLRGTTTQVYDVMRESDVFAFPSLHEGFPCALTEAMSVGLPCVGLKTAPGVNELIEDGVTGFLAENNAEDFAQKLQTLMRDHQLRQTMGQAGRESVKKYAPEIIWDKWEKLIIDTVNNHKKNSPDTVQLQSHSIFPKRHVA
ncbi:MAG: glycosyltransferase [Planctomycetaceae bacterium]|nr:glycosyltransferase [Planctomycetaceae bacterium]